MRKGIKPSLRNVNLSTLLTIRSIGVLLTAIVILIGFVIYQKQKKDTSYCNNCNLIIISVDTLRADHMGTYGYKKDTTPNIDMWAKTANIFEKMYTVFPMTAQSFYTLFTGQTTVLNDKNLQSSHPLSLNNNDYLKVERLPKILKENGYVNAAFVTNPVMEFFSPFFKANFDSYNFINTSGFAYTNPAVYMFAYSDQNVVSKKAVTFLKNNQKGKFFLWLHYLNPHHPYNPAWQYVCEVDKKYCNIDQTSILNPEESRNNCMTKLSENDLGKEIALYDGEIRQTDDQVGQVLSAIKNLHLDRNTIVVFYADHGEGFDHDLYHHGNALYESSVHIPFIVSLPGNSPHKIKGLADNSDILTGILSLLGISRKPTLLTSLLSNPGSKGKQYVHFMTPMNMTGRKGITDGTNKYIETGSTFCRYKSYSEEIYDIQADPQEQNNILEKSHDISNRLKAQMHKYFNASKPSTVKEDSKNASENEREIINTLKEIGY